MPQTKACLPPGEVRGLDPSSSPFSIPHWPILPVSAGHSTAHEHLVVPGRSDLSAWALGPPQLRPQAPRCACKLRPGLPRHTEGRSHPEGV